LPFVGLGASGILSGPAGNADIQPAWSPAGDQIAFTSDRDGNADVYVMNADGSRVKQLTSDALALLYFLPSPADLDPAWSPEGDQIIFTSGRDSRSMAMVHMELFTMQANGSGETRLFHQVVPSMSVMPAWSPDGDQIAFADDDRLYLVQATGARVRQFRLDMEAEHPHWSPAGDRLVFNASTGVAWNVYVADTQGRDLVQLTDGPGDSGKPMWSPDGSRIVFYSNRDGDWEIYVMEADGGHVVQLTDNTAIDDDPCWSPDGRQIAFASDRDGDYDIYVMEADGGNVIQLTGRSD
jgi:Tol biopolymer transport system component